MKTFLTTESDFNSNFQELLNRGKVDIDSVSSIVLDILKNIRENGDKAIFEDIRRFDNWQPKTSSDLIITKEMMKKGYEKLPDELKKSLKLAFERIKKYHEKQLPKSWFDSEENGTILGQKVTAIEKAGLYIPGGKATYPSSLLMNAIPALVAGVKEIIVTSPTPNGELNDLVLGAGYICNISAIYRVGGATAIGAMAYGTETIPKVDVITGPGNIFVATAKKFVFGDVQIDMVAGPSEIGIIADESANPKHLAIDLLSQAEHDEMASSILITDSKKLADEVAIEVENWLKNLKRIEIAKVSIKERGAIIVSENIDEAVNLMNEIAPEHLEVVTKNPFELLPKIKNAGAIFLGSWTPEAIGDYVAGPNHTLPTGGSAKFFSPLSVEHFLKKSSIIAFSKQGIKEIGQDCINLAEMEGLEAHALSVKTRLI
jgi:histidinol dehydrogenase